MLTESLAVLQYIAGLAPSARLGADSGDALAQARTTELLADLVNDVH